MKLKVQFIEQKNMLRDELDDIIDEHDDLLDEYGELNDKLYEKDSCYSSFSQFIETDTDSLKMPRHLPCECRDSNPCLAIYT